MLLPVFVRESVVTVSQELHIVGEEQSMQPGRYKLQG